jgi:hypothetical protein
MSVSLELLIEDDSCWEADANKESKSAAAPNCDAEMDAANLTAAARIQSSWTPKARALEAGYRVFTPTNDMYAIDAITNSFPDDRETLQFFRCFGASFNTVFMSAHAEWAAANNSQLSLRNAHFAVIVRNAESALANLIGSKDDLLATIGNQGDVLAARKRFSAAVEIVRGFKVRSYRSAPMFGIVFDADRFWANANLAISIGQTAGNGGGQQVVEEFPGSSISIQTSNSIAAVEVRHLSFGPGACDVVTRSSLGAEFQILALPGIWSGWRAIEQHAGSITVTLSVEIRCDTGVRSQVRYFRI